MGSYVAKPEPGTDPYIVIFKKKNRNTLLTLKFFMAWY